MRKGFRSSCNGDSSTSTINQQKSNDVLGSCTITPPCASSPAATTLEEMILQLEMEEEMARRAKLGDYLFNNVKGQFHQGRMSCVNSSDILRSARNALNQYPRFSLDGKDAMYRSSFRGADVAKTAGRKSFCIRDGRVMPRSKESKNDQSCLPRTLAGENVVWCKPGVVAKLMGLEVIPVPVKGRDGKERISCMMKREHLRRRAERHEMEGRRSSLGPEINGCDAFRRGKGEASYSKGGYSVMKPLAAESIKGAGGWPTLRFM